jgi:hypothetical protein
MAVEQAAWIMDNVKDVAVDVLKVATSTAGSAGTITKSGTGPTVTVAGAPYLPFSVILLITLGGALGAARFKYSLDGLTYTDSITVPTGGTYVIAGTGLTLTFPVGPYVLNETYSFTCVAPSFVAADVTTGMAALAASDLSWSTVVAACMPVSASAAGTLTSAMIANILTLVDGHRYPRLIVGCGTDTSAAIITAFDAIESPYHVRVAENSRLTLRTGRAGYRKPLLPYFFEYARRCALVAPATSPAWAGLDDEVARTLVSSPSFDEFKSGDTYHQYRIVAPRTYRGKAGVYPTCSLTGAPAGSDYKHHQWCRVIDIASVTIEAAQERYINESGPVKADGSGQIAPEWAGSINDAVSAELKTAIKDPFTSEGRKGYCSGYVYAVDETTDLLTTETLTSSCVLVPLANVSNVATTIGFTREIAS